MNVAQYITPVKQYYRNSLLSCSNEPYPINKFMVTRTDEQTREAVRRFMHQRALKYKPWCASAGISDGALRAYLRKKDPTNMTLKNLEKLAKAAGVPLSEMLGGNAIDHNAHERDVGLMAAINAIFAIMTARKLVAEGDLENILTHHLASFRRYNQPGAVEVMEQLLDALGLKPRESQLQTIQKLLQPQRDQPERP